MDLWYNKGGNVRARRGQAMLEYVLAFSSLLIVVVILGRLVAVTQRYAARAENLVSSEYP